MPTQETACLRHGATQARAPLQAAAELRGLGLTVLQHAVAMHRRRITVESEINQGTTFTVALPRQCQIQAR